MGKIEDLYDYRPTICSTQSECELPELARFYNKEVDIIHEISKQIIKVAQIKLSKKKVDWLLLEGIRYVSWPIIAVGDQNITHYNLLSNGKFCKWADCGNQDDFIYELTHIDKCGYSVFGRSKYNFTITEFRIGIIDLARYGFNINIKTEWTDIPEMPVLSKSDS